MKATVKMNIGNVDYIFEIEEQEELETLHKAIVLGNPRPKCNVCEDYGFGNKKLVSNKDKLGNTYVNTLCMYKGCGAKSKLGQYKAGGYFWREYEKWEGEKTSTSSEPQVDEDKIPF